ncbi:Ig-like domain-containing protein [Lederbergia panacisoli]|uniref:Ig-like domain-containing protein n=1 Tax=Lederbergia panacisoli TaxID=1255251 RepID=UPI00214AB726|nr:Ig-like domain-containing protein [Lederbergia panacisoli]MCR2821440.1 Ig-like domain-containing protein [Lederbergia panacisoli]
MRKSLILALCLLLLMPGAGLANTQPVHKSQTAKMTKDININTPVLQHFEVPGEVYKEELFTIKTDFTDNKIIDQVIVSFVSPTRNHYDVHLMFDDAANEWTGEYSFYRHAEYGKYEIELQIWDESGNYSHQIVDQTLRLTNESGDISGHVIKKYEINVPEVAVPGDYISVSAEAIDESGVDYVEVIIESPSGSSTHGYGLHFDDETGTWLGNIEIYKYFEPGTWSIQFMSEDVHGNYSYYDVKEKIIISHDFDYTPPVIEDVHINAATFNVDDVMMVSAKISENESDVTSVKARMFHENRGYQEFELEFNPETGLWEGAYTIQKRNPHGMWHLSISAENSEELTSYSSNTTIEIINEDNNGSPAVLEGIEFSTRHISLGENLTITAEISSKSFDIENVYGYFINSSSGETRYIDFEYNEAIDRWIGQYQFNEWDEDGEWIFKELVIIDEQGYGEWTELEEIIYYDNPKFDNQPPTIKDISVSHETANVGDEIKIRVKVEDDKLGVGEVWGYLTQQDGDMSIGMYFEYDEATDEWVATRTIQKNYMPGEWKIVITAVDQAGNSAEIEVEQQLTIINPNGDFDGPVMEHYEINAPKVAKPGDKISVSAKIVDDSDIEYADFILESPSGTSYFNSLEFDESTGTWIGNIEIGKFYEPGTWGIRFESQDTNGNYSEHDIEEKIVIENDNDYTPPEIVDVTIEGESFHVGDEIKVSAKITDNDSGVKNAFVQMSHEYRGHQEFEMNYNPDTGLWEGVFVVPTSMANGKWNLSIWADNIDELTGFSESTTIEIINEENAGGPPVLDGIEFSSRDLSVGETLTISAAISSKGSEIEYVNSFIYSPSGKGHFIEFNYDDLSNKWIGEYAFSQWDEDGEWRFSEFEFVDVHGNYDWVPLKETVNYKNKNFDNQAPIIKDFSISPETANVGDEIKIRVKVEDDKSGVNEVWGSLTQPGTDHYIYMYFVYDEEADEWVGSKTVESNNVPGKWEIKISADDHAGNYDSIILDKTITIVNPDGDFTAPIVHSYDIQPKNINVGEKVTITANITDDKSGLREVYASLSSNMINQYKDVLMRYNSTTQKWVGTFIATEKTAHGTWSLSIDAYDNNNNYSYEYMNNAFFVNNPDADVKGPVLKDLTVEPKEVMAGEKVTFTAIVEDEKSEVALVQLKIYGIGNVDLKFDKKLGKWVGSIVVPTNVYHDTRFDFLYILADMKGNITEGWVDETFTVKNPNHDNTPPTLESFEVSTNTAKVGDKIEFKAKVSDDKSGVDKVYASFLENSRYEDVELKYDQKTDLWTGSYIVREWDPSGDRYITITAIDKSENSSENFTGKFINFIIGKTDLINPLIGKIDVTPNVNVNEELVVTAEVTDEGSGLRYVYADLTSEYDEYQYIRLSFDAKKNKWVGTYKVQQRDKDGEWKVRIEAYDNAGNSSYKDGPAFTIHNPNEDKLQPTLDFITVSNYVGKPGETIHFEASLFDNLSGVESATILLTETSYNVQDKKINLQYDKSKDAWIGSYTIPDYASAGLHEISVEAYDKAGNYMREYIEDYLIIINDNPDYTNPVIKSIEFTPEKAAVGDKIDVTVDATDLGSGIKTVQAYLLKLRGNWEEDFTNPVEMVFDKKSAKWKASLTIEESSQTGLWYVAVAAEDHAGNYAYQLSTKMIEIVDKLIEIKEVIVKEVGDNDTSITGTAEPGVKVVVKAGSKELGSRDAKSDGKFEVPIAKQKAGTVLTVYAEKDGRQGKSINVTVKDKTPPTTPTASQVSDKDTKVTGKAEAGSTLTVKVGTKSLGSDKAKTNGDYSVTIKAQKAGTVLLITATDANGNASTAKKITVIDKTPPKAPTASQVSDKDKKVTGKAEASSTVTVKAGTKVLGSAKAKTNGDYSVAIKAQKAGTVLSITATDAGKNVSTAKKITVIDKTPPSMPTASKVSDKDKKVTGKAEAGSKITVKAGKKVIGTATTSKSGKYTVTFKSTQKAGTVLYITATDKAKNVSSVRKVTVSDKTPPAAPKVNKVTIKSTIVKGTTEANSTVYVKVGKKVIASGKAGKNKSFSIKIKKQKAGVVLQVYAKDKAKNVSKITKVTVKRK